MSRKYRMSGDKDQADPAILSDGQDGRNAAKDRKSESGLPVKPIFINCGRRGGHETSWRILNYGCRIKGKTKMNDNIKRTAAIIAAMSAVCGAVIFAAASSTSRLSAENGRPDVVYWPTPQVVVDKMLETARVSKTDLIYDLGCGDARSLVTAAKKYGTRGVGFDLRPDRVADSRDNARKNGVESLVEIRNQDIFTVDLTPATVIFMYLFPEVIEKLIPQLQRMRPGSRIVSHEYEMEGVTPKREVHITGPRDSSPDNQAALRDPPRDHTIYLWETPLEVRPPAAE